MSLPKLAAQPTGATVVLGFGCSVVLRNRPGAGARIRVVICLVSMGICVVDCVGAEKL